MRPSLSARPPPGPSTRTSEPREREAADRGCRTHLAWVIEGSCRCLWAHVAAQLARRQEGPRTPMLGCSCRILRKTSMEEGTSRAQKRGTQVSVRGMGRVDSLRAGTALGIPTFFPGLARGRRVRSSILLGQMLSKARRPAALPSNASILGWRPTLSAAAPAGA